MKERIRSTHVHDNNGKDDIHLFPLLAEGGTIDWKNTMELLRSREDQFPLVLELKERPRYCRIRSKACCQVFDRLGRTVDSSHAYDSTRQLRSRAC